MNQTSSVDLTYLAIAAVIVPVLAVQFVRLVPLALVLVVAIVGVAAEGRHRGHGATEIVAAVTCSVVLSYVWGFVLATTGLLIGS